MCFLSSLLACVPHTMSVQGRYDHLNAAQLRAVLDRRDREARYGLVWEREGIEPDRAVNDDFVTAWRES